MWARWSILYDYHHNDLGTSCDKNVGILKWQQSPNGTVGMDVGQQWRAEAEPLVTLQGDLSIQFLGLPHSIVAGFQEGTFQ